MDLEADRTSVVAALVRRAAGGDRSAWDGLVDRFAPLLLAVTRRYRMSGEDAQDVAQTVWLRLVEHLSSIREPAALPGWLVSTAAHECQRVLAAGRRTMPVDAGLLAERGEVAVEGRAEDHLLRAERHEVLLAAFAALSDRQRELLLLLIADPPASYSEITARLGIPVGSIGPTRARALQALRDSRVVRDFVAGDQRPADSSSVVSERGGGRHGVRVSR